MQKTLWYDKVPDIGKLKDWWPHFGRMEVSQMPINVTVPYAVLLFTLRRRPEVRFIMSVVPRHVCGWS